LAYFSKCHCEERSNLKAPNYGLSIID